MTFKTILFAAAVVAVASSTASAQTDNPNVGNGPSLGGSVAPLGVPGSGFAGLAGTAGVFAASSGGMSVPNPSGGNVAVPGNVATAIGGLLGGNPTADQRATARESFGGTTAAGALVDALTAMGANATPATVSAAVQAYNAAVQALPAGQNPGPGLLAARSVLAGFVQP